MTKIAIRAAILLCPCVGMMPGGVQVPAIESAAINPAANQTASAA